MAFIFIEVSLEELFCGIEDILVFIALSCNCDFSFFLLKERLAIILTFQVIFENWLILLFLRWIEYEAVLWITIGMSKLIVCLLRN